MIKTSESHRGQKQLSGKLISRDEHTVYLNQKGRKIAVPRSLITEVQLCEGEE